MKLNDERKRNEKNRPRSIIIAAILMVIQGLGLLGYGIYQLIAHGWGLSATAWAWRYIPLPLFESLTSGIILTLLGAVTLLVAVSFLMLARRAWQAAMTLQGFGLLVGLINYLRDRPNYIGMALGVILVLYLNHREVQEAFRLGSSPR
jgi:hypothetical protein